MNEPAQSEPNPPPRTGLSRVTIIAATLVLVGVIGAIVYANRPKRPAQSTEYYETRRSDFLISIVEGGTLEAVNEIVVRSEVEGTARIIFIVPEGSYVKKGDMLVELDSSSSQDTVNQQQINVEKADFALLQAKQQLDIQQSVVDSEVSGAKLKLEFAQTDLDKYVKGEALQTRRNAQIEITNVIENLDIAKDRLLWTEQLYKDGYETKSTLDKDRLTVQQTELKLEQAQQVLWMLETFDEPKKKRSLQAAVDEASENLERVRLQSDRKLAQFRADVDSQKTTLELSRKKLERDMKQLQATKIYAPQEGLVVYSSGGGRFSSESLIEEGAVVRNRQELIKLPDISEMKLSVKIHESHITQIRLGQPAYVVLDAMPDQRFKGVVTKVAPLPDSQSRWGNPNLKVYPTEILVTEKLPEIKPGVSARAEIIVTNLTDVISVPLQAVTTRKGQQVVYLTGEAPQPLSVEVGMYNTRFVQIISGLGAGQRVLLSPPADTEEKDLGGAIIGKNEKVSSQAGSNDLKRAANRIQRAQEKDANGGYGAGAPGRDAFIPGSGAPGQPDQARQNPNRRERQGGDTNRPPRLSREELLKQFDTNGDGELDDSERAAMRERMGRDRPRRDAGTNAASPEAGEPATPRAVRPAPSPTPSATTPPAARANDKP